MNKADWPLLSTPALAAPLNTELAYRKRQSAETQARNWNTLLADDPIHGPESGFTVGVAPIASIQDGQRYELIWINNRPQA